MTILVVRVVPEGIVLAADRFSNSPATLRDRTPTIRQKVAVNLDASCLVGYAGAATLNGMDTLATLIEIVDGHSGRGLRNIAMALESELTIQLMLEFDNLEMDVPHEKGMLIHLVGYNQNNFPEVWFIRNFWSLGAHGEYFDSRTVFQCSNELSFNLTLHELNSLLRAQANSLRPFGFQQGFRLTVFNELTNNQSDLEMPRPVSLNNWVEFTRNTVQMYSQFCATLPEPERYIVGGGVDVLSIPAPQGNRMTNS